MIAYDTFKNYSLFEGLDLSQPFLERLASISEESNVAAGEWIFHDGDDANALYLIQHGTVVTKLLVNPETHVYSDMSTLSDGHSLGWSVMVKPYMYQLAAMAMTDTQLIKIDGPKLRQLTMEDPEDGFLLMQGITQTMASRLQDVSHHVPELTMKSVLSMLLMGMTIFTSVLGVVLIVGVVLAVATGSTDSVILLLCLVVPAVLYLAARALQDTGSRSEEIWNTK